MYAPAGDGVQINRQSRHQRLAFTRTHFGDLALVQRNATQHLRIEMTHTEDALAAFAYDSESLGQQIVQGSAGLIAFAERLSFGGEFGIAQGGNDRLMPVDLGDQLAVLLDQPVVTAA